MGDQNQYQRPNDTSRADFQSPKKPRALSENELLKVEKNQELLSEVFPELLPHLQELIDLGMIGGLQDVRVTKFKQDDTQTIASNSPEPLPEIIKPSQSTPKINTNVVRDSLHPITGESGYDVLNITAHSYEQLQKAIEKAITKDWIPCPVDENFDSRATLYKKTIIN